MHYVTTKSVSGWGVNSEGEDAYITLTYCKQYRIKNFLDDVTPEELRHYIFTKIKSGDDPMLSAIKTIDTVAFYEPNASQSGEWRHTDDGDSFVGYERGANFKKKSA